MAQMMRYNTTAEPPGVSRTLEIHKKTCLTVRVIGKGIMSDYNKLFVQGEVFILYRAVLSRLGMLL